MVGGLAEQNVKGVLGPSSDRELPPPLCPPTHFQAMEKITQDSINCQRVKKFFSFT